MDYTAHNIGLRVNEAIKKFKVIVKQDGAWKEVGHELSYPLPDLPTLGTANSASDVAILMLEIENPSGADKFKSVVYPR